MDRSSAFGLALLMIVPAVTTGCAQNHPYRMTGNSATGWQIPPERPIERDDKADDYCRWYEGLSRRERRSGAVVPSVERVRDQGTDVYALGYVEIDDHGSPFSPQQLTRSLEALRPGDDAGVVMVTFVHGWNHNANPCDGNVKNFRVVLRDLADGEAERARRVGQPPRHIVGMYIGWRGQSFRTRGLATPFTFWARKHGAHRVGERSAISVLGQIQRFAEEISAQAPQSGFVTIGHSFGAAVVHTALEANLVPELAAAADAAAQGSPVPRIRGLGHVTILLNPAFEAARYRQSFELADQIRNGPGFSPDQKPVLVSITSGKDQATRRAFKFGMRMRSHRGSFVRDDPRGDEKQEYLTALGHHAPYRTPNVELSCVERDAAPMTTTDFVDDRGNDKSARASKTTVECSIEGWRDPSVGPLLSVYDPHGTLMSGHNDIFNEQVQQLLWRFVGAIDAPPLVDPVDDPPPTPPEPDVPPTMHPLHDTDGVGALEKRQGDLQAEQHDPDAQHAPPDTTTAVPHRPPATAVDAPRP
ncbi:MAG: hypothetical protein K0V04_14790 [Deltaproteobacteria bacterium]|nr:hypothetical protein [Deltaproteobacteria bacterium]